MLFVLCCLLCNVSSVKRQCNVFLPLAAGARRTRRSTLDARTWHDERCVAGDDLIKVEHLRTHVSYRPHIDCTALLVVHTNAQVKFIRCATGGRWSRAVWTLAGRLYIWLVGYMVFLFAFNSFIYCFLAFVGDLFLLHFVKALNYLSYVAKITLLRCPFSQQEDIHLSVVVKKRNL